MSGDARTATGLLVDAFGDWRTCRTGSLPLPAPGPGEVRVEIEAAALNFPDLMMIAGTYQTRPDPPFVAGRDAAGRVAECGPGVARLAVGDRVALQAVHGAFADRISVPETRVARLPESVGARAGAAAATVLATAHVALERRAGLRPGERVLVTGAAGGVGTATLRLARHLGAVPVAVVSSAEKAAFAEAHGAAHVLRSDSMTDPRRELREALRAKGLDGVDVLLDVVGGEMFHAGLRALRPEGRLLTVGYTSGELPAAPVNYLLLKDIAVIGSPLEHYLRNAGEAVQRRLEDLFAELGAEALAAMVSRSLPFGRFADAAAAVEGRTALGKIVIEMQPAEPDV